MAIVCLHPNNANKDYLKYMILICKKKWQTCSPRLAEITGTEIEEIEVEERELDGVSYLVDDENNILNEDGDVIGKWPPTKRTTV